MAFVSFFFDCCGVVLQVLRCLCVDTFFSELFIAGYVNSLILRIDRYSRLRFACVIKLEYRLLKVKNNLEVTLMPGTANVVD